MPEYIDKYGIKSIIDLRFPGTDNLEDNPVIPEELLVEIEAIKRIDEVKYFNIGSDQIPDQETINRFLEVMDGEINYPVLIHCHHGEGRAILFSSIYRMEYADMPNDEAREKSRFL